MPARKQGGSPRTQRPPLRLAQPFMEPDTEFADWIAHADDVVLECHDIGHLWSGWYDRETKYHGDRAAGTVVQVLTCKRGCKVVRERKLGEGFAHLVNRNSYDYSDSPGYLLKRKDKTRGSNTRSREAREQIQDALRGRIPVDRIIYDGD